MQATRVVSSCARRPVRLFWFGLALGALAWAGGGCAARHPLEPAPAQWQALAPEQPAESRARQQTLAEQKRAAAKAERQARAQERQAQLAAEKERIAKLYAEGQVGDVVRVSIQGGVLDGLRGRQPIQPAHFEIAKGESKRIRIATAGSMRQTVDYLVRLAPDGTALTFDADQAEPFVMANSDWANGQAYVSPRKPRPGRRALLGASFFVKYREKTGAMERAP